MRGHLIYLKSPVYLVIIFITKLFSYNILKATFLNVLAKQPVVLLRLKGKYKTCFNQTTFCFESLL